MSLQHPKAFGASCPSLAGPKRKSELSETDVSSLWVKDQACDNGSSDDKT